MHALRSVVTVPNPGGARNTAGSSNRGRGRYPNNNKRKRQASNSAQHEPSQAGPPARCAGCGGNHARRQCPYKESVCNSCQIKGHLARECRTAANRRQTAGQSSAVRHTQADTPTRYYDMLSPGADDNNNKDDQGFLDINQISPVSSPRASPSSARLESDDRYVCQLRVEGILLQFEIDTGSAVTIVPITVYQKHLKHLPLRPCPTAYRGLGGTQIPMLGVVDVQVAYPHQEASSVGDVVILPLAVCSRPDAPLLLGRPWLRRLPMVIQTVQHTATIPAPPDIELISTLRRLFPSLFELDGTAISGYEAQIYLKEGTIPVRRPAYSCPLALRAAVEAELDRMVANNELSPVLSSQWATPVIPLRRPGGAVRLCGDYRVTVNPSLEMAHYPLPHLEEMVSEINGKYFFVVDLHRAYLQMPIAVESQGVLTWNTHKGFFKCLRMPYGIASAPAIFQNFIETILKGLSKVRVLIDDVIGYADTRQESFSLLLQVMQRFVPVNTKIRIDKCQLLLQSVKYVGYNVSKDGVRPLTSKVADVQNAPAPSDVSRLKAFLGLVNWHARFIPNLAHVAYPLNRLTRQNEQWRWTTECQQAFEKVKSLVTADSLLVPYRLDQPLRVTCDASPHGLSAILAHVINGQERVVAYASHTLTSAEQNYAQIMREAAAIMFAMKRFYQYLIGRPFELVTNRALASILGSKKGLSQTTIGRLQRWTLILGGFQYRVVHKPGTAIPHADALSRLPAPSSSEVDTEIHFVSWAELPITAQTVADGMSTDRALVLVKRYVQEGWPIRIDASLAPFYRRRHELSLEASCLLWGERIIIPVSLRERVLASLHEAHPGINRMKGLARSHVWWPTLDQDLEALTRDCLPCQQARPYQPAGPVQSWPPASRPWERLHVDHASYLSLTLLVLVDAYSRWPVVQLVPSTDAPSNIAVLRGLFAAYGFPELVCSDNGPPFSPAAFRKFLESTGTRYLNAPPYRPQANGLAEGMVDSQVCLDSACPDAEACHCSPGCYRHISAILPHNPARSDVPVTSGTVFGT